MNLLFQKSTRFANLKPIPAVLILLILLFVIILGIISPAPLLPHTATVGKDFLVYQSILERIHAGEGYYEAAQKELRSRRLPTKNLFNWRLPLLACLMGHLPGLNTSHIIAIILSVFTLGVWISLLRNFSIGKKVLASILLWGPVIHALVQFVFLLHEFWAGTLIALSLAAYARGWRVASLASGVLALFLRELTLPFVCVMAIIAYIEGHRREAFFWILGIIGFGISLEIHWLIIHSLITEVDLAYEKGWLVFGGWSFVLSTARMHPFLIIAPYWVNAVSLPLALLGLIGWIGPLGLRVALTVGIYIIAFLFVGYDFNMYWGIMYVGILPLGLLYAPYSLRDLIASIRGGSVEGLGTP